jgi:hypothetical protein
MSCEIRLKLDTTDNAYTPPTARDTAANGNVRL